MNALVQYTVPDMERMALAIAGSKLFGIQSPDQALALCLVAQAEGRHPASAAQDYHIIQNRPSKKADAMLRDFLASGGKVQWHALDDSIADATFSHPAGGSVRIAWDMARVKKAGIKNADMYGKFPRQMLRSRTVSEGVRTVYPMATSGMYVPEEVQEFDAPKATPREEAGTIAGEFTEVSTAQELSPPTERKSSAQAKRDGDWSDLKTEVDACATAAQLDALVVSRAWQDAVKTIPRGWVTQIQEYVQETRASFAEPSEYVEPNFEAIEERA